MLVIHPNASPAFYRNRSVDNHDVDTLRSCRQHDALERVATHCLRQVTTTNNDVRPLPNFQRTDARLEANGSRPVDGGHLHYLGRR